MPVEIEVTYRVVTPLFCAGSDPARPELRVPSFKGVLRYWWRALAWSRCSADLETIRQQEDALFGSAGGGQSRVSMRLALGLLSDHQQRDLRVRRSRNGSDSYPQRVLKDEVLKVLGQGVVGDGARYLGYGVMKAFGSQKGQVTRSCLLAPFSFTVLMRGRKLNETMVTSLKDALIALGTIGGMGAKSRKGYGSLVIQSLRVDGVEYWSPPQSLSDLRDVIGAFQQGDNGRTLPEFTALSQSSRHVLLSSDRSEPLDVLDLVGREMVRFRSWGHKGKILGGGVDREMPFEFKDDHDLMKRKERTTHPRRIAFGLPHNYGNRDNDKVDPLDKEIDRRASPLFIHIHECGSMPVAVLSFLPAQFLPRDSKGKSYISVGKSKVPQRPEDELYRPIHDFLDRLLDRRKRKEKFTSALEVRP